MYKKLLGIALVLGTVVVAEENKAENPFEAAKKRHERLDGLSQSDIKGFEESIAFMEAFLQNGSAEEWHEHATKANMTLDAIKNKPNMFTADAKFALQWKSIVDGFDACQNPKPDGWFSRGNRDECDAALHKYWRYAIAMYKADHTQMEDVELYEKMLDFVGK